MQNVVVIKKNWPVRDFAAGVYLSEAKIPIPPPPYTLYASTYSHREGGRVEPERRLEEQQLTKLGWKIQTWLTDLPL